MKKNIMKIIVGIVISIVVVVVIWISSCINNFWKSDGIQVFGKFVHINYQEKCYLIDSKEEKIVGESTFTISGILYDRQKRMFEEPHASSTFSGHMEVDAYPISLSEEYAGHLGAICDNEISFTSYKDMDSPPYYWVHILRSNPEVVLIHINLENGENLTAVCAQSEDEAWENYQQYFEEFVN